MPERSHRAWTVRWPISRVGTWTSESWSFPLHAIARRDVVGEHLHGEQSPAVSRLGLDRTSHPKDHTLPHMTAERPAQPASHPIVRLVDLLGA